MPDATADDKMAQDLARVRALVGELSVQLQEATQARTNMGVSLRLMEAQLRVANERIAEMEKPKSRSK